MNRLALITRHPIKAHGRELLASVVLSAGATLPHDRRWAIAHEAAKLTPGWVSCNNFLRGAKVPQLMAMEAAMEGESLRLTHPQLGEITVNPDDTEDAKRLISWVKPLVPAGRAQPVQVIRFDGGLTDSDYPTVSILNLASLKDLSARMGLDLSPHRFRGNLWLDGAAPWEEFSWIGRRLQIGEAVLEVTERITRCRATCVDPATGEVMGETLDALDQAFGHKDFGIFASVIQGGKIAVDDAWSLI
ncbi:MOSC domain-containing protein [Stagnihabitans tardus]|uniref:MOSC domain-containing protein n=1 Tax=Stagnihabitans tardus TaxID=2699202 RepID=A0AAE4YH75_9RHOB|nr:MOSC domain-containing protein [Stagnihabitans tardus]NBZ89715.1 MOSC domain-containing protein [Stagnihabitans tardus]